MSFAEVSIDSGLIVYGLSGNAAGYFTDVAVNNAGYEFRNQNWAYPLGAWELGQRDMQPADIAAIVSFFHARRGKFEGFRLKDWSDYQATATATAGRDGSTQQGIMAAITPAGTTISSVGTGYPTYQLAKTYTSGGVTQGRLIRKPVSGTVTPYRNGTAVTLGTGAGNYLVDTTTGIVSFTADASSAASVITVGTTTQVTLAANLGLVAGKLLYLSGFTGADAALVNGIAHTINSVSGTGPYVFTLNTNTAGKTITLGSGTGYKYPQASDTLTASFQFDVPVRFDVDRLPGEFIAAAAAIHGQVDSVFYHLPPVPIVEIRV